ncbi:MAG: alanine racemase C-terminal domain-containing protein, partial [Clostridia bacterium]|nr:alanine racemase C-terminal domain-containing protein [Clostridia bacterium]
ADNSNCFNKLKAKVHLKLDSGMNRLGVKTNCELAKLLECVSNCHNIEVEGCYSHLYNVNNEQYNKFYEMFETVKKIYPDAISHISSSSAVCENGTDKYDMVRLGIAAYGYGDEHLKPVMSVSTKVVASKSVSVGEHIGYGDFVSTHNCSIAIIFGGYADGILRNGTGYVVLRNQKCKILSVVCMDMTIIETVGFEAEVGECAEFICESQNAEEFARDRGTIAYEALTGFSRERCEKIYLN